MLLTAVTVLAADYSHTPDQGMPGVVDLTESNWASSIGDKPALVEFYAPWCGHCKSLAPEWANLGAAAAASAKGAVTIGKVDATKESSLGSKYSVTGYPTIKFFKSSTAEAEEYNGGRNAADFVKFLQGKGVSLHIPKVHSHVVDVTASNWDTEIAGKSAGALVEFYAPWCGHCKSLAPVYEKLAAAFEGEKSKVVIAKVDADASENRPLAEKFGVTGFPTLKWLPADSKGAAPGEAFEGGRDLESLVAFVNGKVGTHRKSDGDLADTEGHVSAAASLVKGWKSLNAEEKAAAVAELAKTEGAEIYRAIADKAASNAEYLAKEIARIEGMLAGGKIKRDKRDTFIRKLNVLKHFA